MSAEYLLGVDDPTAAAREIPRFELTHAVKELRKLYPRPDRFDAVAVPTARALLNLHGWQPHARSVGMATLLDCGLHQEVTAALVNRLTDDQQKVCDLLIASRILREGGRTNSGRWVHGLAMHLDAGGPAPTAEVRAAIVEALVGPTQRWETVDLDAVGAVDEVELETLEVTVPIPGLDGTTLRPVKSTKQCNRFANRLNNCASSYAGKVKIDATRLFGIEVDGHPVELIEVQPISGRIVQWKGPSNREPDPRRRPIVEQFLFANRLAVPQ